MRTETLCVFKLELCVFFAIVLSLQSTIHPRAWECQSLIGATSPCLIRWNFLAERERDEVRGWGRGGCSLCSPHTPTRPPAPPLSSQESCESVLSGGDLISEFEMFISTTAECCAHNSTFQHSNEREALVHTEATNKPNTLMDGILEHTQDYKNHTEQY